MYLWFNEVNLHDLMYFIYNKLMCVILSAELCCHTGPKLLSMCVVTMARPKVAWCWTVDRLQKIEEEEKILQGEGEKNEEEVQKKTQKR